MNLDMFSPSEDPLPAHAPLAARLRPSRLDEVVGQEHLTAPGRLLATMAEQKRLSSLVFWGPPGTGKTTLARVLARSAQAHWTALSAVSAGVREVRAVVADARRRGGPSVLFLDEIHRFHRGQQDALLPHVETGEIILLGATTENPALSVNAALLSRCRVARVRPLTGEHLRIVLRRAVQAYPELGPVSDTAVATLIRGADADARKLLGALELAAQLRSPEAEVTAELVAEAYQQAVLRHDRSAEEHYNLLSVLQKSIRTGDVQGAVYWLTRLLESGEQPRVIGRRLVRMAVEDVGLADGEALPRTVAAYQAADLMGLPEGGAALVQAAVYLASAPKSNRVVSAQSAASQAIAETGSLPVPAAYRQAVTERMREWGYGEGYRYDHEGPGETTGQETLPPELAGSVFYRPTDRGDEAALGERLSKLEAARRRARETTGSDGIDSGSASGGGP